MLRCCGCREYEREATGTPASMRFAQWLRLRCAAMSDAEQVDRPELMALSMPPNKKVCAFSSMTSFGSHYRVDVEEEAVRHVTYDSGVAELACRIPAQGPSDSIARVELVRVGVLKNILVLTYGNLNIVLMVVSWVPKHTDELPMLRRDAYGFWIANMSARPRDTTNPYILPALASQVNYKRNTACAQSLVNVCWQYMQMRWPTMQSICCRCSLFGTDHGQGGLLSSKKTLEAGESTVQRRSTFLGRKGHGRTSK
jgi:hypothetical protein